MLIAYIFSSILVLGAVALIVGPMIRLKKLVSGEITPEEFGNVGIEFRDTEMVAFRGRIGDRLVASGKKILGKEGVTNGSGS